MTGNFLGKAVDPFDLFPDDKQRWEAVIADGVVTKDEVRSIAQSLKRRLQAVAPKIPGELHEELRAVFSEYELIITCLKYMSERQLSLFEGFTQG